MPEVNQDYSNIGTGILVIKDNKVLLGKRLGNSYLSGSFGVPGGRVKIGESLIESAKRELLEETGLKAKKIDFVGIVNDNQRGNTFLHLVFVCKSNVGEPKNLEPDKCGGWVWYEMDFLPEHVLPGHKAGIEMYIGNNNITELM